MLSGLILASIWSAITGVFFSFWQWIVGASVAILAFLFSPTLRKYSLGAIAALAILAVTFMYGYNSNHHVVVTTHKCSEFASTLVQGPATDKALRIFQKHGLCVNV